MFCPTEVPHICLGHASISFILGEAMKYMAVLCLNSTKFKIPQCVL